MKLRTQHLLAAATLLALAGCSLLTTKPEEYSTFALDVQTSSSDGAPVDWQLQVEEPIAATPIAGARIAERDTDRAFGALRGARWSERAPELVQSAILRSFEDSGRMRGVGRSSSSLRGDYLLSTELRDFEVDYSQPGAPMVRVTLSAKLLASRLSQVIDARVFVETEAVHGSGIGPVIAAFNSAANRLVPELRDWVFAAGQKDAQAAPTRAQ